SRFFVGIIGIYLTFYPQNKPFFWGFGHIFAEKNEEQHLNYPLAPGAAYHCACCPEPTAAYIVKS
ncbi:MAG: hypothetical protein PUJ04_00170, partial [Bacteroidales bacterium]|nr:hypothetical protein [Bacteroidales bacterium]